MSVNKQRMTAALSADGGSACLSNGFLKWYHSVSFVPLLMATFGRPKTLFNFANAVSIADFRGNSGIFLSLYHTNCMS